MSLFKNIEGFFLMQWTFPTVSNYVLFLICSDIPIGFSEWEAHTVSKENKLSLISLLIAYVMINEILMSLISC